MAPTSELADRPVSQSDRDFDDAAEIFTTTEQLVFTRDFMDVLRERAAPREGEFPRIPGDIQWRRAQAPTTELQHYILPGIPGREAAGMDTIRPLYGDSLRYHATDKRVFLNVWQGSMWEARNEANPVFNLLMTECSVIVGFGDESTMVAHISYSDPDQAAAVVQYMQAKGVAPNNMCVIAALLKQRGPLLHGNNRIKSVDEYAALGVPLENILPFEYDQAGQECIKTDEEIHHGVSQLTVTPTGLVTSILDMHRTRDREWIEGDYRNERFFTPV